MAVFYAGLIVLLVVVVLAPAMILGLLVFNHASFDVEEPYLFFGPIILIMRSLPATQSDGIPTGIRLAMTGRAARLICCGTSCFS